MRGRTMLAALCWTFAGMLMSTSTASAARPRGVRRSDPEPADRERDVRAARTGGPGRPRPRFRGAPPAEPQTPEEAVVEAEVPAPSTDAEAMVEGVKSFASGNACSNIGTLSSELEDGTLADTDLIAVHRDHEEVRMISMSGHWEMDRTLASVRRPG